MVKENRELENISRKLDLIVRLLAYQLVSDKTIIQGAPILRRLGFTVPEIANVFDTTSNSVSVRLAVSRSRKKRK